MVRNEKEESRAKKTSAINLFDFAAFLPCCTALTAGHRFSERGFGVLVQQVGKEKVGKKWRCWY